jgi:aspartate oxidase
MALSDELTKLAARTKEAEDRAEAARGKTKAALEEDVAYSRATAEAEAERLRETMDSDRDKISAWWHDMQRSWDSHIASVRSDIEARKAEHDLHKVQKRADRAEGDAEVAIDFARAALVDAEYAVLDAALMRMEAEEAAAAQAGAPA